MFTLQINTDHSAFDSDTYGASDELGRILRDMAGRVQYCETLTRETEASGVIYDRNGNKCGSWTYKGEES